MPTRNRHLLIQPEPNQEFTDLLSPLGPLTRVDLNSALERAISDSPRAILIESSRITDHESILSLCKALRGNPKGCLISIILLLKECSGAFRIAAFESFADDVIALPCPPEEVRARVQSRIKRLELIGRRSLSIVQCGNLELNLDGMEAHVSGRRLQMSVLQFNLLAHLVKNANRVIKRPELLEMVWRGSTVSLRTIDTHIVLLRKKLTGCNHSIDTVYGAGYIFKKSRGQSDAKRRPAHSSPH